MNPAADTSLRESRRVVFAAERATLGYGSRVVLRDVEIEVHAGDFWFLLGPNGSGKSTFARAALGLLNPMSGKLRCTSSVGYVPQHCSLHATLATTLREYVSLGLASMKVSAPESRERVAWAIGSVGLESHAMSDMRRLSGGMRQRAMVARALVRRPELLVLDEPTSNLDPGAEEALLSVLARLLDESDLAVLFVCHDVAVAARYATQVAVFHDGVVRRAGLWDDDGLLGRLYGVDMRVRIDDDGHAIVEMSRRTAGPGNSDSTRDSSDAKPDQTEAWP
jgi:ABC-type Mn2+/Zn2+ transport system ATPase subunit